MGSQRRRGISSSYIFLLSIFLSLLRAFTSASAVEDRIVELPGQPKVQFAQYSGYVTVNKEHGRALFYWLTEATTHANKKPLVLWLNGGPGCSSVAYGASEEIGPFRIRKTGSSLYLNKYSWNREANILFMESPAGVGFSYTNTSSDLMTSGDKRTAQDAFIFLNQWMERFPQYKHREFYIAGESYSGHYVPQLAKQIQRHNKAFSKPTINLKGFIVGNAVMDNYHDNIGTVTYWWTHSMISDQTYRSILAHCNFTSNKSSRKCDHTMNYATEHEFGNIDPYNIYSPSCTTQAAPLRFKNTLLRRRRYGYDPCTEHYADRYYNRLDVQKAMHANVTGIPYRWATCSDVLSQEWGDSEFSMLPTYKELMASGLRIWVFSGDTDSVVPVTATRFSISHLNLTVKIPWYPWYSHGQVGGWTEVYEGLTFATVRGAGHEVPLFQPKRAFRLFQAFLANKPLPKS